MIAVTVNNDEVIENSDKAARFYRTMCARILLVVIALATALPPQTFAQESPHDTLSQHAFASQHIPDSTRQWYDTIAVTRPRFARATLGERLALAAFTALALPVAISVGALTLAPPSMSVLSEHDGARAGLAIGTGWGVGGDTSAMIYYPDIRMQIDFAYYIERERPIIAHAALLTDLRIASLHPRDFFWFAVAGGAGVSSDLHNYHPYVEGWIGVLNPMGIRFAPLFPMHHYGFRTRVGYDVTNSFVWYELSIGVTSTFGF